MKVAVIGLGVEGKKALNSLIKYNCYVYASDLNADIDIDDLPIYSQKINFTTSVDSLSLKSDNISVDLGFNDFDEIDSCDAVAISPSMWGSEFAEKFKNSGKLLCDIKNKHRDIFTIAVTGTNGKTTTVSMIKEILENAGKNVLVGGNAGGGFEGYYDLILESDEEKYDVLVVEVCDMTLGFCDYCFDFDLVALTNMGNDHMDVHGSIEEYKESLKKFFKDKTIFINKNQEFKDEFKTVANNVIEYDKIDYDLEIFGRFNKLNAGLSQSISDYVNKNLFSIDNTIIKNTLENFKPVKGRLEVLKLNDTKIYIGKTDNSDALNSVLSEVEFNIVFIGTPRHNEEHRFDILNELVKFNPDVIILFPGLEDTLDQAIYRLHALDYTGRIEIANNLDEIIGFVAEFSHEPTLFIGGNGQQAIIEIQDRLKQICASCNRDEEYYGCD